MEGVASHLFSPWKIELKLRVTHYPKYLATTFVQENARTENSGMEARNCAILVYKCNTD